MMRRLRLTAIVEWTVREIVRGRCKEGEPKKNNDEALKDTRATLTGRKKTQLMINGHLA